MKIMLISNDPEIISVIKDTPCIAKVSFEVLNQYEDPLEILSAIYSSNPTLLIVDDDCLRPQSEQIIRSIKKINKDIGLIFFTSNTSIDLGKKVSQHGVFYYAIKPVTKDDLHASLKSILKKIQRNSFNNHQLN